MSKDGIYVCAEMGVNWDGDMALLMRMVTEAVVMCECDAVKLQLFNEETIKDYEPEMKERLQQMILQGDQIGAVSDFVHEAGKDLVVTPMYKDDELMRFLAEHNIVDGFKIRAKDWTNRDLITSVKGLRKPLYVSIPHKKGEVIPTQGVNSVEALMSVTGPNRWRLYCVPKYPPEPEDLFLHNVVHADGVSLHSPRWWEHYAAAVINTKYQYDMGTKKRFYVEVHYVPFTPHTMECIDIAVSLCTADLKKLVDTCKDLEEAIG